MKRPANLAFHLSASRDHLAAAIDIASSSAQSCSEIEELGTLKAAHHILRRIASSDNVKP